MKTGDLYSVLFPHEEDKTIKDERPSVVLCMNSNDGYFYALKVTTQKWHYDRDILKSNDNPTKEFVVELKDWREEKLGRPSFVICRRKELIAPNDIITRVFPTGYIGTLSQRDLIQVDEMYRKCETFIKNLIMKWSFK